MTRKSYVFTMEVVVSDEVLLAKKAREAALESGIDEEDWDETRSNTTDPISSDLIMLLDSPPGNYPPLDCGFEVQTSACEPGTLPYL